MQKVYKLTTRLGFQKERGGEASQTLTEIRGIPGVTTVRIIPGSSSKEAGLNIQGVEIRFELLGEGTSPKSYKNQLLLPELRKIKGLVIYKVGSIEQIS